MSSMSKVTLIGHLGQQAELRYTPGGAAVANVRMATTEVWNDKSGQKQEKTIWHNVTLWGKPAETLAEYLTKGKQIYVEGKLDYREWEKDGTKHRDAEIRAERVVLLGGGSRERSESRELAGAAVGADSHSEPLTDDEIPFGWLLPFLVPAMGLLGVLSA